MMQEYYFLILIAIIAFLYASVGHGGASGYLALMYLFGTSAALMKPSALILNLFVSSISFYMYYRHGYFQWKKLWPFIILSVPFSFIGANVKVDEHVYKIILGICLIIATLRLLGVFGKVNLKDIREVKLVPALFIGGILGLISGMIGIGGGILLSPVLLLLKWADLKQAAAISAAFIFVNSAAGIIGNANSGVAVSDGFEHWVTAVSANLGHIFSSQIIIWAVAGIIGGTFGAFYGSKKFNYSILRYILSAVLVFASYKLLWN
jgi:uncharacterized membrane protein YfcA